MNDDLISRQAAIYALDDEITITGRSNAYVVKDYVQRVRRKLENLPVEVIHLPSAQPEPKKGRWIRLYYNRPKSYTRICSECRETCWFCGIGDYNYCPWCGANMVEGEEEKWKG